MLSYSCLLYTSDAADDGSGGLAFARAYAGAKALHNFSEGNPFVLEFLSHDKLWYNEIAQNKSYIFL